MLLLQDLSKCFTLAYSVDGRWLAAAGSGHKRVNRGRGSGRVAGNRIRLYQSINELTAYLALRRKQRKEGTSQS